MAILITSYLSNYMTFDFYKMTGAIDVLLERPQRSAITITVDFLETLWSFCLRISAINVNSLAW
jgi:hypothetical protein